MNKSKAILTFSLLSILILLVATAVFAAVEINYFQVQSWIDDVVTVEWETSSEQDIAGFYVWRSHTNVLISAIGSNPEEQGLVLLNDQPIVNEGTGCSASSSQVYTYPDDTVADEQDVYYYYLQAIKCNSTTQEFYDEVGNPPGGLEATRPTGTPTATPTPTPTGTPTPTPTAIVTVTPTATATATATVIDSDGGELTSPNGMVQLNFPPGAVNSNTTVTYTQQLAPSTDTGSLDFAGTSFDISAVDANGDSVINFLAPFTITLTYTDTDWENPDISISDENQLNVYWWDGSNWVGLPSLHDLEANQFTIVLDHLSEFALLGRQGTQLYLPILQK